MAAAEEGLLAYTLASFFFFVPFSPSAVWNVDAISGILAAILDHEDECSRHSEDGGAVGWKKPVYLKTS